MFDIGPSELILIFIVALLVIGPEKLPSAIRTASLWVGRFRRSFHKIKAEVERELNTDEIKRQLHNESILEEVEKAKSSVENFSKDIEQVAAETGKDSDDQSGSSLTSKTPSATTEPQTKQNNNAPGGPTDTKVEQKKEDNSIAGGLKQAVSYVNDISREVKQSAKEIEAEFESAESTKKPESGDKK